MFLSTRDSHYHLPQTSPTHRPRPLEALGNMGRDLELFKAAQNGNVEFLEKAFSCYLTSEKDAQPSRGKGKKQSSGVR